MAIFSRLPHLGSHPLFLYPLATCSKNSTDSYEFPFSKKGYVYVYIYMYIYIVCVCTYVRMFLWMYVPIVWMYECMHASHVCMHVSSLISKSPFLLEPEAKSAKVSWVQRGDVAVVNRVVRTLWRNLMLYCVRPGDKSEKKCEDKVKRTLQPQNLLSGQGT